MLHYLLTSGTSCRNSGEASPGVAEPTHIGEPKADSKVKQVLQKDPWLHCLRGRLEF